MTMNDVYNISKNGDTIFLTPKNNDWKNNLFFVTGMMGDEKMIKIERTTASRNCYNYVMYIMKDDGKSFSFDWGYGGYTLISEGLQHTKKTVMNHIHTYYPGW